MAECCCVTAEKWLFQRRHFLHPMLDLSFLFNHCFAVPVHWLFSTSTLCIYYHYSLYLLPLPVPMCNFVVRVGFSLHSPINVDFFIIICKENKYILWRELQE